MENENIIPVKTDALRVYRRGGEICAVDLEYGRSMVLNETETAVFKLCSGGVSIKRIAAALKLPSDSAAAIIKKFMEHRFIVSYTKEADEDSHFLSPPSQTLVFDCQDLSNAQETVLARRREELDAFCRSDGAGAAKILFIKNFDWRRQAEVLVRLLEAYARPFSAEGESAAPFKPVCELFSLPEPADFIGGEAAEGGHEGEAGLSALGRLWRLFHRFSAQLILIGSPDFWRSGAEDAGSGQGRRQELGTGELDMPARCAETAAMLYETSLRFWKIPACECGRHFMQGLSIMPAVLASDADWDECVKYLVKCGYRTLGVRFAEKLLEEGHLNGESLQRKLGALLDFIRDSARQGLHIAVYPLERWRRCVRGDWPRSKSRRRLEREYAAKGERLPLACRRCPGWYYCLACDHYQPQLPCQAVKPLTERALWNI